MRLNFGSRFGGGKFRGHATVPRHRYRATGWRAEGCTAGFQRVAQDFYQVHDRPKQLFVRELVPHAARTLRARALPAVLARHERAVVPHCRLTPTEVGSLWQALQEQVPESRNVQGLRHKQVIVLAIIFGPRLGGGLGGHHAVALFAKDLSPTQRATFRCWFNRRTRRYDVLTENCIYRVLKAGRGSRGTQWVSAVNAQSGRTLGVQAVADKSNGIPAAQTPLQRLELNGMITLLDALHTQVETARAIVQDGGGGFVLVVKGNEPTLLARAQNLLPEDFSPAGADGRTGPRPRRVARHRGPAGPPNRWGFRMWRSWGGLIASANSKEARRKSGPSGSSPAYRSSRSMRTGCWNWCG